MVLPLSIAVCAPYTYLTPIMFKDVSIETKRLVIRTFKVEYHVAFQKILAQEEVMNLLPENVMSLSEVSEIV